MKILIIDAQGGGLGKEIITAIRNEKIEATITATGTNSAATINMAKAKPDVLATGENAIKAACRDTDFIIGPIGIAIANSLLGEISPKIAKAVGKSRAKRILIPFSNCNNFIPGTKNYKISELIKLAVDELKDIITSTGTNPV